MKSKFITICVILAAILAFMSFTAVLMPKNSSSSDEPEVTTEEKEPVIKTFQLLGNGSNLTVHGTFSYEEGMTWAEFVESEYNTYSLEIVDGYVYQDSYVLYGTSELYEDDSVEFGYRPDNYGSNKVSSDSVISYLYYVIED